MNCRCGKDDHDVQDDDEDIGKVVIGKLFERPARTRKEELEFSYGWFMVTLYSSDSSTYLWYNNYIMFAFLTLISFEPFNLFTITLFFTT